MTPQLFMWIAVFSAIAIAILIFPSLLIGRRFRHHPHPPVWAIVIPGTLAVLNAGVMFAPQGLPYWCNVVLILGLVSATTVGGALLIRRNSGLSFAGALGIPLAISLGLLGWMDFQFRMIVSYPDGRPFPMKYSYALQHPSESYLDSYQTAEGKHMGEGILYFGLLVWLEHKGKWRYQGSYGDSGGHFPFAMDYGRISPMDWPVRVTVVP